MADTCTAPVSAPAITAHIVTRSQHSVGGSRGFGGPDHYVAIVLVPQGAEFDPDRTPLRPSFLAQRGIKVVYCGEYYGRSTGPRSRYAACMRTAQEVIARRA